jgi:hypothetical protein
VSGILDFVALLTGSPVADYCASARGVRDCRLLRVPVDAPPPVPALHALSPVVAEEKDGVGGVGKEGEEDEGEKGDGEEGVAAGMASSLLADRRCVRTGGRHTSVV